MDISIPSTAALTNSHLTLCSQFDCLYVNSFDHLDALMIESLVPIFMLVLAQLYTSASKIRSRGGAKQHVLSAWLYMLFLILPVISRRICQSFRCGGPGFQHQRGCRRRRRRRVFIIQLKVASHLLH